MQSQPALASNPRHYAADAALPLAGVKVLDLSTLLPGPLATLMLAEAGAEIIKLERPGGGDEMRSYEPVFGEASANYALLNRNKRAFAVDFKDPQQLKSVQDLMGEADIVMEQFRPGVADRLGLGYQTARELNPQVIYCSITGYGQEGELSSKAGHDLNFLAESGLLNVIRDSDGAPPLPMTVIADIAGGTYPAVINILLALRARDQTGNGTRLDISMAHNLQTLSYGYAATHRAGGGWPEPGKELLTGGSPRYRIYPTSDGRHVAVAALEDKFWDRLVQLIGLPDGPVDDTGREEHVIVDLQRIFAARPSSHWRQLFDGQDVCTSVVNTFEEAVEFGLMAPDQDRVVSYDGTSIPALHTTIDPTMSIPPGARTYPALRPLPDGPLWKTGTSI